MYLRLIRPLRGSWAVAFRSILAALAFGLPWAGFAAPVISTNIIPATRLTTWTPGVNVGIPGGIPTYRTHLIDVTQAPYNADSTGMSNASAAIQAAITAAKSNDVVYLPAGTYRLNSTINISKSGVTVRGAGPETILMPYGNAGAFCVGIGAAWNYPSSGNTISGGFVRGAGSVTVANTSGFVVGDLARITFNNDATIPVVSDYGYNYLQKQTVRITAKTATTVSFYPPFYGDYPGVTSGVIYDSRFVASKNGIENLTINSTNSTFTFAIQLQQCYACWVQGVNISYPANYDIFLVDSVQCEIRHCVLGPLNHGGSNGAGLLHNSSSGSLVEDNAFDGAFPQLELNAGSSGNVFSYNFATNAVGGQSFDVNHGPHNRYNLFEGNMIPNVQCDGYFGGASEDTFYRNWFYSQQTAVSRAQWTFSLNRFTRNYSIVGNVLGNPWYATNSDGISTGNPNMGNGSYTGYGPPWVSAVRAAPPGATVKQTGSLVTSSVPFFISSDVGGMVTLSNSLTMWIDGVSNSTLAHVTSSGAYTNMGFCWAPGPAGYQELDTNVVASMIRKGNWDYATKGVPAAESVGTDVLPISLIYAAAPLWWPIGKPWPLFGPEQGNPVGAVPSQDWYATFLSRLTPPDKVWVSGGP